MTKKPKGRGKATPAGDDAHSVPDVRKKRVRASRAKPATKTAKKTSKRKLPTVLPKPAISYTSPGRPQYMPTAEHQRLVEQMAKIGMAKREMADVLGISWPTFLKYAEEYFDHPIAKGKSNGKFIVGKALHRMIDKGNVTAAIWYEKTRCGYSEKVTTVVTNPDGTPVENVVQNNTNVVVAVGLFLPSNGREVVAPGQSIDHLVLPPNGREILPPSTP